jgi:hypothetical protein
MKTSFTRRAFAVLFCCLPAFAQNNIRGHWTGVIETPGGQVTLEVDLDQGLSGWIGSIAIPAQGVSSVALEGVTFRDGKAAFRIRGAGTTAPAFTGKLATDGQVLEGEFAQGATFVPLKLVRNGEANVQIPKTSPPVAPEFVGTWQGTIQGLRVQLTMANVFGAVDATFISLDQGAAKIPVTSVTQQGTKLRLKVDAVGGGFEADLGPDGAITGNWTQQGSSVPLVFRKAAK